MNGNKKLFAFDLDGTLLNSKSELSKENYNALLKASKAGHILLMVTGRNYIYAQMAIKEFWGVFNYFVGCNGAIIHSIHNRDLITLGENKIPFEFVMEIIHETREIGGTLQISTEWEVFVKYYLSEESNVIPSINKQRLFDPFQSIFDMDDKNKKSIVQISVHLEEHNVRKYKEIWEEKYGNEYEFTITSKHNIDINRKGISKLEAIKDVVKMENILYDDVYVFGDSQNDIKGLEYYNNTYAMDNAFDEVKKASKHVIGNNDSNDIAKIILKNI